MRPTLDSSQEVESNYPESEEKHPISHLMDERTSHQPLLLRTENSLRGWGGLCVSLNWQHKKSSTCNILSLKMFGTVAVPLIICFP